MWYPALLFVTYIYTSSFFLSASCQSTGGSQGTFPECANSCVNDANFDICELSDLTCLCQSKVYLPGIMSCLQTACAGSDLIAAQAYEFLRCEEESIFISVAPAATTLASIERVVEISSASRAQASFASEDSGHRTSLISAGISVATAAAENIASQVSSLSSQNAATASPTQSSLPTPPKKHTSVGVTIAAIIISLVVVIALVVLLLFLRKRRQRHNRKPFIIDEEKENSGNPLVEGVIEPFTLPAGHSDTRSTSKSHLNNSHSEDTHAFDPHSLIPDSFASASGSSSSKMPEASSSSRRTVPAPRIAVDAGRVIPPAAPESEVELPPQYKNTWLQE